MDRFVVISGCSGGGKSTLLEELRRRGYSVVEEPGRRIIAEELQKDPPEALPWLAPSAFARRAIEMSIADRHHAQAMEGKVFFDRGLIDAASALEHLTGQPILEGYRNERYNKLVFMTPPWPEIYTTDADRKHGLKDAIEEYERLLIAFTLLDYDTEILPKTGIAQRVDIILRSLKLM